MLHRTTSTPIWPKRWIVWPRGGHAGLHSTLAHYLLIAAALCALGCIYLWQASDLSLLYRKTLRLEWQVAELEKENIRLVQQSAYWNAPSYIEKRMREEGFIEAPIVVHTRLPEPATQPAPVQGARQIAQSSSTQ